MKIGAQYYRPPFPVRSHWKADLRRMRESGLNTVQLWVLWAWVEPVPGAFRFAMVFVFFQQGQSEARLRFAKGWLSAGRMSGGYMMCIGNHIPFNVPGEAVKRYLELSRELAIRENPCKGNNT